VVPTHIGFFDHTANSKGGGWTSTSHVIAAVLLGCIMGTIVICWVLVSFAECLLNAYRYSRWCTERLVRASRRCNHNGCTPRRSSSLPPSLLTFFRRSGRRNRIFVRHRAPSRGGRRESYAELIPFVSIAEPPDGGSSPTCSSKLSAAAGSEPGSRRETSNVMSVVVQAVDGDEKNVRCVAMTMPQTAAGPHEDFTGMDANCRQQLPIAKDDWQPRMAALLVPACAHRTTLDHATPTVEEYESFVDVSLVPPGLQQLPDSD
jgi:hypothetical protein